MNPYESGAVIDMNIGHNSATRASIGAPAPRYKIGYRTDEWGERSSTPGGIPDPAGAWVRYDDHAAALARAALSTAAQPTAGIWVPTELAERVQETMGEFLMDHGWRQQDMDTSDEFGALLAVATKAAPAQPERVHGIGV